MEIMNLFSGTEFVLTKWVFQRSLAFIYFIGFLIHFNQGLALMGDKGILPAKLFLRDANFFNYPSIFFLNSSDFSQKIICILGLFLSILGMVGITDSYGYFISMLSWFFLWALYLSFVNIGQIWYSFGWESLLLETGFLSIFLGPTGFAPPILVIYLLRWVCFRNFFGAGLIKWRGDKCWRDLTCMYYYYETQPIPNPLSIYFHRMPKWIHHQAVYFTFFVELIVPFGLFLPLGEVAVICSLVMIFFQSMILVSGNLSWLNYISIILCLPGLNDKFFSLIPLIPSIEALSPPHWHLILSFLLFAFVAIKSIYPIKNMLSSNQSMNRCYDPFHLVNTYGAFGSITKERNELVILGTEDPDPFSAKWLEYEFKGKPTNPNRCPPLMSPYHWRLDWLIWFAAFSDYFNSPWILNFLAKLLSGQKDILALLKTDPFDGRRPKWVRVDYYRFKFQDPGKPGYWKREYLGEWLPPLSFENPQFLKILKENEWLKEKNPREEE